MINYQEFVEMLMKKIEEETGLRTEFHEDDEKMSQDGIWVYISENKEGIHFLRLLTKESYCKWKQKEATFHDFVREVKQSAINFRNAGAPDKIKQLMYYDLVKERLFIRLINFEKNKAELEDSFYKRIGEIAMVLYEKLADEDEGMENSDNKESNNSMKTEELNENVSSLPDTENRVNNENLRKKAKKKYKRAKEVKEITKLKTPEDLQKYIKNLEYAAKVGYKKAIYKLGMAYKYDTGVESDFPKAVECFFRVGKLNMEDALYELADCYRQGIGLEKSEIKAECLIDILRSRDYTPKSVIDISLCNDGYIEAKEEIEEFYENFSPKTEEERNLEELIKVWKNK